MLLIEMTKFNFESQFIGTLKDCGYTYFDACDAYRFFVAMTFDAAIPAKPQDAEKRLAYTHTEIMKCIEALGWQSQQLQLAF